TDLLDDRRGRDVQGRLPGGHEPAAQAREDLLEPDRLAGLELQLLDRAVTPGLGEEPLRVLEHLLRGAALPADRPLGLLQFACSVDYRDRVSPRSSCG